MAGDISLTREWDFADDGAFPRCYVEKYPDHDLRWLNERHREAVGMEEWSAVDHDPQIDDFPAGPGGTVRKADSWLGKRLKARSKKRADAYAARHKMKINSVKKAGQLGAAAQKLVSQTTGEQYHGFTGGKLEIGQKEDMTPMTLEQIDEMTTELEQMREEAGLNDTLPGRGDS